ncbi:MAG: hypothetical protein M1818_003365 [Claussenomyces sp. TS43310]|nr:MAG: hypothetical protein M1818_003365 [Claussenomyces sp. TS43310]
MPVRLLYPLIQKALSCSYSDSIRRVKCDEAKPNCVRCTSTGRKCDGYQTPQEKSPRSMLPATRQTKSSSSKHVVPIHFHGIQPDTILPNPGFLGTSQEQRGLEYFRTHTAKALSGYFDSDFWSSILPQVAHDEPIVRHAVLALSALHEGFEVGGDYRPGNLQNTSHQQLALQQYNHAVTQMVHRMSTTNTRLSEVTLITCLLFIFLELMQNNHSTAVFHLNNGLRILATISDQLNAGDPGFPPSRMSFTRETVAQLYARILTQSVFFGVPCVRLHNMPAISVYNSSPSMTSIAHARTMLDHQFIMVYPFLVAASAPDPDMSELYPQQALHSSTLQEWYANFSSFNNSRREHFTTKDSTGATLLQLHYICLEIILAVALDSSEAILNKFAPSFGRIIALTESLIGPGTKGAVWGPSAPSSSSPCPTLPNISFDTGIIPPLFYTALKCRSLPTRLSAVALLQRAPHREGIWSSAMASRMAQRIVEIDEEEACKQVEARYHVMDTVDGRMRESVKQVKNTSQARTSSGTQSNGINVEIQPTDTDERSLILLIKSFDEQGQRPLREEVVSW